MKKEGSLVHKVFQLNVPVVIKTRVMSLMTTGAAVEAFTKSSFSRMQEPREKLLIECS